MLVDLGANSASASLLLAHYGLLIFIVGDLIRKPQFGASNTPWGLVRSSCQELKVHFEG